MSNSSFILVLYAFHGIEQVGMFWLEILWPGIDGGELVMQNRAFYCLKKKTRRQPQRSSSRPGRCGSVGIM